MWGQIAQAVSGAVQSKANYNQTKPLQAGDYGHAASALPTQNTEHKEETSVKEPEIKEAEKEEVKDTSNGSSDALGSLMNSGLDKLGGKGGDAVSDGNTKDTTQAVGQKKTKWNDLSWDEKRERINDVTNTAGNILDKMKGLGGNQQTSSVSPIKVDNYGSPAVSDGTLKNKEKIERLFQNDNAIKAFSDIDAYVYKYNQKAQDTYAGEKGVDDSTHFGPIAQDLAKNPVTSGAVHRDESGYLTVDTRQLALTNTAMISQLARKIEELEERLGGR